MFLTAAAVHGADAPAKFLGANFCASTSCHGGGGHDQNQSLVWSLKDFHSQRPVATLGTARSKQIADTLDIKDATADVRCTTCHAPLQTVPENLRGEKFAVGEGVSCESCHGPAERWLRSHTRKDYTRADRTAAGMRDLQDLYVRANTCVACHQNVDADILKAGHPELIFELDGQSVAEPKHWSAEKNGNGAQAWLVGQAVALRELSWQLSRESSPSESEINCWNSLVWIFGEIQHLVADLPQTTVTNSSAAQDKYAQEQMHADKIARTIAALDWTPSLTAKCLKTLANTKEHFGMPDLPVQIREEAAERFQARRAERLVLGLDRLVAAQPELKNNQPLQSALNQLFKLAQSIPDFDPKQFADALQKFSQALNGPP